MTRTFATQWTSLLAATNSDDATAFSPIPFKSATRSLVPASRCGMLRVRAPCPWDGAIDRLAASGPESLEYCGGLLDGGAEQQYVEVAEIGFRRIEIGVANVAPADDGDVAVGDPRLVCACAGQCKKPEQPTSKLRQILPLR